MPTAGAVQSVSLGQVRPTSSPVSESRKDSTVCSKTGFLQFQHINTLMRSFWFGSWSHRPSVRQIYRRHFTALLSAEHAATILGICWLMLCKRICFVLRVARCELQSLGLRQTDLELRCGPILTAQMEGNPPSLQLSISFFPAGVIGQTGEIHRMDPVACRPIVKCRKTGCAGSCP